MEVRYTPTPEDALNALRASPKSTWAMFLFVLLLSLMFVVGIYPADHNLGTLDEIAARVGNFRCKSQNVI